MSDFDITWNGPRILDALSEPFHQANETLGRKFTKEIGAPKWSWPTEPSPRDIVDTGELRRSYAGERESPVEHSHSWNLDYAMAVHEGAKFKDGHTMPARPWTKEPINSGKLERNFEKLAGPELGRIK